jgi:hypothetical protein
LPIFLLPVSDGTAIAGEGPSTQQFPAPQPALTTEPVPEIKPVKSEGPDPVKSPIKEDTADDKKNVDKIHDNIEQGILGQVIRLDNFFGEFKIGDELKTGYQLQERNSVRVDKSGKLSAGVSLRANATLSRISNRLRLYISGDNGPEPIAPRLPEDPGNPGFESPVIAAKVVNTELRYGLFQTPSTDMFLGAGFRLAIPSEAFVRSRVQHTYHINDATLARLGETLFVNSTDVLGETTEISLERTLNSKTLLRWASTGTVSYKVNHLEWGTELSLLRELSSKSAITLTGGVYGNTGIDDVISNFRLLARYRRNFLRSWLFYELVPEVSWPRKSDGLFPYNYAMTFVLEVVFKGK